MASIKGSDGGDGEAAAFQIPDKSRDGSTHGPKDGRGRTCSLFRSFVRSFSSEEENCKRNLMNNAVFSSFFLLPFYLRRSVVADHSSLAQLHNLGQIYIQ